MAAGLVCSIAWAADTGVEVHGYIQNRIYVAPGANPEFRTERVSLSTKAALANNSIGYVELYYHPWTSSNGLYLESAYYDTPLADGRLRVGKGRRIIFGLTPSYPVRRTSNYGIVAEAFTQDRIQGAQYTTKTGKWDLAGGFHTAYRLGIRNAGEIPGDDVRNNVAGTRPGHVVSHLCLRDPSSGSGNPTLTPNQLARTLQFSGRAGYAVAKNLNVGFSGSIATLDERDLANLNGTSPDTVLRPRNPFTGAVSTAIGTAFTSKTMRQLGGDVTYKFADGYTAQGEFYDSKVSNLGYNAWDILACKEMTNGWKYIVRYSQQNMDIVPTDNPLTWDINQISLSMVQPIRKNVWLQYEYEFNGEHTNTGRKVANDLFFVELFSAF